MKLKLRILHVLSFVFAAAIPFYNSQSTGSHTFGKPIHLVILGAGLYFLMGADYQKRNPLRHTRLSFSGYFFLFAILVLLSMGISNGATTMGSQLVTYYLELAIVYLLFSSLLFEKSVINACFYGLMFGFCVSVFIALMQFLKIPGFNMFKDDELNANVYYSSQADAVDVLRIWGPFGNALTFSYYLSVAGCLLFYFYFYVLKRRIIAWAVFGMTLFGISVTISRTALFAFLFCLGLVHFFAISRRKRVSFLFVAAVLLVVGSVYVNSLSADNPLLNRLNSTQDDFKGGRLNLWETGYKTWLNGNVFFGTGPGNLNRKLYENGWRAIYTDAMDNTPGHVENYYLTLLFTFGLVAFFFYLLFMISYVQAGFRLLMKGLKEEKFAAGIPFFGSMICLLANNLTNPAMHFDVRLQVLMILQMAIANNLYKQYILGPGELEAPLLPLKPITI
ncbi:MAG TPA: O-antigen ligase family protein [Puia sp.]|nr:O-antigen ligase family protein [Puia sp.]